jgi:hypothetical protein
MYASLCTLTIYSATPTIQPNIGNMYVKYCGVFGNMDYSLRLINANGTEIRWSSSAICFRPMASPCLLTKSKQSRIGPSLGKSKTFSLSSALPISTAASSTTIQTSPFLNQAYPQRHPLGIYQRMLRVLQLPQEGFHFGSNPVALGSRPTSGCGN